MVYFIALAALAFLFYRIVQAGVLFKMVVKHGRIASCSGSAPRRLRREFEEVVMRNRIQEGSIKVVVRAQAPALMASEHINPGVQQMLRNILGQFSLAELRSAPRMKGEL